MREAAPSVRHVALHGQPIETQPLRVSAQYVGGKMGNAEVQSEGCVASSACGTHGLRCGCGGWKLTSALTAAHWPHCVRLLQHWPVSQRRMPA